MKQLTQPQLIHLVTSVIKGENAAFAFNALMMNATSIFEMCGNKLLRISIASTLREVFSRIMVDLIDKGDFKLEGGLSETLIHVVEEGPLYAGDLIAPSIRDDLLKAGLVCMVPVKGEDGFTAATHAGKLLYLKVFQADTIKEAMEKRKAGFVH